MNSKFAVISREVFGYKTKNNLDEKKYMHKPVELIHRSEKASASCERKER